jgi:pyruvate dehydrogenase E2 component (dihydrolipoamide acetyltransferase)
MALVEVKVPDIGDFKDVESHRTAGQARRHHRGRAEPADGGIDKASMEIPSSHAGVVKELKVKLGDKVSEGSLVLVLEAAAAAAAAPGCRLPQRRRPWPPHRHRWRRAARRPAAAAAAAVIEVLVVPDIGDFDEVAVIEVFVKPGDTSRSSRA